MFTVYGSAGKKKSWDLTVKEEESKHFRYLQEVSDATSGRQGFLSIPRYLDIVKCQKNKTKNKQTMRSQTTCNLMHNLSTIYHERRRCTLSLRHYPSFGNISQICITSTTLTWLAITCLSSHINSRFSSFVDSRKIELSAVTIVIWWIASPHSSKNWLPLDCWFQAKKKMTS